MSEKKKIDRPHVRDIDMVNSEAALRRAAIRAREQARSSAGYVVIYRDGEIVKEMLDKRVV